MHESFVTIPAQGAQLHGVLRSPEDGRNASLVVLCDPFAEEKKCSHRPMTEVARAMCRGGFHVLHFDYRGCGDSPGDFVDFGVRDWAADIRAAVEFAIAQIEPHWVCLGGLRVGATLASQFAAERSDIDCLILLEPVIDGNQYVRHNLRRSMIKAMLTEGGGFDPEAVKDRHESEVIDFDGYELAAGTAEQLKQLSLAPAEGDFAGPVLVLNIGPRTDPTEEYVGLADAYLHGLARAVRLEPFWNRIGLIDPEPVIDATMRWLSQVGPR